MRATIWRYRPRRWIRCRLSSCLWRLRWQLSGWRAGWILKKEANRKRNLHILLGVVLAHCAVFCIAWNLLAQSALRADPLYIHAIGGGFALSDLNESAMDYLYTYPHQAGQALLVEIVYRIFGYENFFAFRMVNTLGVLVLVVSGFAITGELFRKDRAQVNFRCGGWLCSAFCVYKRNLRRSSGNCSSFLRPLDVPAVAREENASGSDFDDSGACFRRLYEK